MKRTMPRAPERLMKKRLVHGSWRRVGAKIVTAGACALMVGQLLLPSVALAAEWVNIGGTQYDTAANGTGWDWDGGDNLNLNDYMGSGIYAHGDLTINATGDNTVYADADTTPDGYVGAIGVEGGDLTLTGASDSTISAWGTRDVVNASATRESDGGQVGGNITVDGVALGVVAKNDDYNQDGEENPDKPTVTGIVARGGDVTLKNGAVVSVNAGVQPNPNVGQDGYGGTAVGLAVTNEVLESEGFYSQVDVMGNTNRGGNIYIEGKNAEGRNTQLSVSAASKETAFGIVSAVRSGQKSHESVIAISGGAFVRVNVDVLDGVAYGIYAAADGVDAWATASIDGKESDVDTIARAFNEKKGMAFGILTASNGLNCGGGLEILGGKLHAQGTTSAVLASNLTNRDGVGGTIRIGKNGLIAPEGTAVRDFWTWRGMPQALGDAAVNSAGAGEKGQLFASEGEGVLDYMVDETARDVTVTFPASEDPDTPVTPEEPTEDPVTPPTDDKATAPVEAVTTVKTATKTVAAKKVKPTGSLPKTGDNAAAAAVALAIAGAATVAASATVARRRRDS